MSATSYAVRSDRPGAVPDGSSASGADPMTARRTASFARRDGRTRPERRRACGGRRSGAGSAGAGEPEGQIHRRVTQGSEAAGRRRIRGCFSIALYDICAGLPDPAFRRRPHGIERSTSGGAYPGQSLASDRGAVPGIGGCAAGRPGCFRLRFPGRRKFQVSDVRPSSTTGGRPTPAARRSRSRRRAGWNPTRLGIPAGRRAPQIAQAPGRPVRPVPSDRPENEASAACIPAPCRWTSS